MTWFVMPKNIPFLRVRLHTDEQRNKVISEGDKLQSNDDANVLGAFPIKKSTVCFGPMFYLCAAGPDRGKKGGPRPLTRNGPALQHKRSSCVAYLL